MRRATRRRAARARRQSRRESFIASAREKIKAEKLAKTDDWRRRTAQARTYKTPDEHAICGIRWYCRSQKDRDTGCYWHNCHKCGQKLIYTSDPHAKPQICKADIA